MTRVVLPATIALSLVVLLSPAGASAQIATSNWAKASWSDASGLERDVLEARGPLSSTTQAIASSFRHLGEQLETGRTIWVETAVLDEKPGPGVKGKVLEMSSSTLTLEVKGARRTFAEDDVLVVSERHTRAARGALIGLGIGAGLGAATLAWGCAKGAEAGCGYAQFGASYLTVVGVSLGAMIGKGFHRERVLFRAADLTRRPVARVAPFVGRGRAGVAGHIRF